MTRETAESYRAWKAAQIQAARAIHKSIMRNHPFFRPEGGEFGYDMRTFRLCYPADAAILRHVLEVQYSLPTVSRAGVVSNGTVTL